ncbi:MAG: R3H domain-containing nucleic acid-binding protein [Candidatus Curtissbacteria bacterium]|nr:R3H domain-containing nucleic acid-binding protein [Candidatus Curtissbacteria bacterium]
MTKLKLDENFVAENVRQIIEMLGVSATAEVSKEEDTLGPQSEGRGPHGPVYVVDISSEDSSLLIGKHGANLESLQFILAVRLKTLTGQDDFEIFVDVDNFRRQKEDRLEKMARQIAEKVGQTGNPEPLYDLSPSERRLIHTILTDNPQVTTISEGEGIDRHLIIKPK